MIAPLQTPEKNRKRKNSRSGPHPYLANADPLVHHFRRHPNCMRLDSHQHFWHSNPAEHTSLLSDSCRGTTMNALHLAAEKSLALKVQVQP